MASFVVRSLTGCALVLAVFAALTGTVAAVPPAPELDAASLPQAGLLIVAGLLLYRGRKSAGRSTDSSRKPPRDDYQ